MRRALSETSDSANATPSRSQACGEGQENQLTESGGLPHLVPNRRAHSEVSTTPAGHLGPLPCSERPLLPARESAPLKSSPLKRADRMMSLEGPSFGSPSAKRRSLHGPPVEICKDSDESRRYGHERNVGSDYSNGSDEQESRSNLVPRFPIQRRSQLPHRVAERSGANRNRHSLELPGDYKYSRRPSATRHQAVNLADTASPDQCDVSGSTTQCSTEHGFSAPSTQRPQQVRSARQHPHPLSQAVSPTSPTFEEIHNRSHPDTFALQTSPASRPTFARSLPIGALRPDNHAVRRQNLQPKAIVEDRSFATPESDKTALPHPAPFRSTGILPKRRNLNEMPPPVGARGKMPDTPIKKGSGLALDSSPDSAVTAVRLRFAQPEFGTPSKPFNLHPARVASESSNDPLASFVNGSSGNKLNRKASFVSSDGDESAQSPSGHEKGESQSSDDLPPTPTRSSAGLPSSRQASLRSRVLGRRESVGAGTFVPPDSLDQRISQPDATDGIHLMQTGYTAEGRLHGGPNQTSQGDGQSRPSPAFADRPRFRQTVHFGTPTHFRQEINTPMTDTINTSQWPPNPVSSTQPSPKTNFQWSPHTPGESLVPDPSQLSISPQARGTKSPVFRHSWGSNTSGPPETPTARRESGSYLGVSITPTNRPSDQDIDLVLSARFKKVEWCGATGFSHVYKVYEPPSSASSQSYFSPIHGSRPVQAPLPDKVWIVKRSKSPYRNQTVRDQKLQEASIMLALGKNDHTLYLHKHWETNGFLYLQTEFCEEGTLDEFLKRQAIFDRLDDFRIWKILIELTQVCDFTEGEGRASSIAVRRPLPLFLTCYILHKDRQLTLVLSQGVKHIHDSGFLHLDLKPANVFVDFEGVLKIGDFGHACKWPAPENVEGEGDRRYMGADLLQGRLDKPADIFALGVVMFEIASNSDMPDNGSSWQKLRSGDFSGLPSLTTGSTRSLPQLSDVDRFESSQGLSNEGSERVMSNEMLNEPPTATSFFDDNLSDDDDMPDQPDQNGGPPRFMLDPLDDESLDNVVKCMMRPDPVDRPVVDQILQRAGCTWVNERRRGGALIFEGKWGPTVSNPIASCPDARSLTREAQMVDV